VSNIFSVTFMKLDCASVARHCVFPRSARVFGERLYSGSSHLLQPLEFPQVTFEKSSTVNKRLHRSITEKDLIEIRAPVEINEMPTTGFEFLLRSSGESMCNRLSRLAR